MSLNQLKIAQEEKNSKSKIKNRDFNQREKKRKILDYIKPENIFNKTKEMDTTFNFWLGPKIIRELKIKLVGI